MSKMDLSSLETSDVLLDTETGAPEPQFDNTKQMVEDLDESLSQLVVVIQDFMANFQQTLHDINMRFGKIERSQQAVQTILTLVAQRTDWMMDGRADLIAKEIEFIKAQKAMSDDAKEHSHESQKTSLSELP